MKKILTCISVITTGLICTVANASEIDRTSIDDLVKYGIVDVADDYRFDDNISRAEAIKMICNAAQLQPDGGTLTDRTYFNDVPNEHWAYKYITMSHERGWVNGYEDDLFYPERSITSSEMQKMIVCALGYNHYASTIGYPEGYLSYGEILGLNKNISVAPSEYIDRGEAMLMVYNSLDAPIMKVEFDETEESNYKLNIIIYDGKENPFKSFRTELEANQ